MKKIISFILGLMMCISLSSCVTTAYAQTDDELVDVNVVVTYGTPYYDANGLLLYYFYRDLYYYPYYYGNRWYFRHYIRPLPPRAYRAVPRDFYNHRPHVSHNRPHVTLHRPHMGGNRGFGNHRPNIGSHKPNGGHMRPSTPRSSTKPSGHVGHRR